MITNQIEKEKLETKQKATSLFNEALIEFEAKNYKKCHKLIDDAHSLFLSVNSTENACKSREKHMYPK